MAILSALGPPRPAGAATQLIGAGSSFAGIELQQWTGDVSHSPYNLSVNYQSSSSGQGRQNFYANTVDFAVSDIRYDTLDDQGNIPNPASFAYIPVTAGGISFMYNLQKEGFTKDSPAIHLSSKTICGMFGTAIQYWDDNAIKADNPGVNLPHVPVTPVVRNDGAGTNYVLEEYCLATQASLYTRFIQAWNSGPGNGPGSTQYPTNAPTSFWPLLQPVTGATGSDGVADQVANTNGDGYVGAVETGYAIQRGFPVAAVQNDAGAYVLPTASAVAAALGHATQLDDGTQQLNFTPGDGAAYNPSTYSYMLVRLAGRGNDVGAAVTEFANYCLTIGQAKAPELGYATINRSLIQFGLNRLKAVPGYVAPTADELAAIPSNSANSNPATIPSSVPGSASSGSAGSSGTGSIGSSGSGSSGSSGATPGGGSLPGTTSPAGTAGALGSAHTASAGRTGTGVSTGGSGGGTSSGTGGPASGLAAVDPSASLGSPTGPLGQTGVESDLLAGGGGILLALGEATRRLSRSRRRVTG